MTLAAALPGDALMATTREQREAKAREGDWTTEMELLAQVIEEISVVAADMRRKKPREIPRPSYVKGVATGRPASTTGNPYADAIDRLMGAPSAA